MRPMKLKLSSSGKGATYTNGTLKMRKAKCSTPGARLLLRRRDWMGSRRSNNSEVEANGGGNGLSLGGAALHFPDASRGMFPSTAALPMTSPMRDAVCRDREPDHRNCRANMTDPPVMFIM